MALAVAAATVVLATSACAPRTARLDVGPLAAGLEPFVAAHPLPAAGGIRADEVARTPSASWHVVQVRGSETPHRHVDHDITVLVLRGQGTLTLDGVARPMRTGDAALVPRGRPHWFASTGAATAIALVVFTPSLDAPDSEPVDRPEARR